MIKLNIKMYTDGSGNYPDPYKGGWAVAIVGSNKTKYAWGGYYSEQEKITNNQMELKAVIEGLRLFTAPATITIYTDSNYIVDNLGRISDWKANDWRTSSGKPCANVDLWKELTLQLDRHQGVEFEHIPGHSGNDWNEKVDDLAGIAAKVSEISKVRQVVEKVLKENV